MEQLEMLQEVMAQPVAIQKSVDEQKQAYWAAELTKVKYREAQEIRLKFRASLQRPVHVHSTALSSLSQHCS